VNSNKIKGQEKTSRRKKGKRGNDQKESDEIRVAIGKTGEP
jgi:hypothetical protein